MKRSRCLRTSWAKNTHQVQMAEETVRYEVDTLKTNNEEIESELESCTNSPKRFRMQPAVRSERNERERRNASQPSPVSSTICTKSRMSTANVLKCSRAAST